jgi:hypothetical protein
LTTLIRIANTDGLARFEQRTRRTWILLASALAALTAAALVLALTERTTEAGVLPAHGSTVIVLDLSGSTRVTLKRVAKVLLERTEDGRSPIGLVVFSDTAYEALPLQEPSEALRSWLTLLADRPRESYPWSPSFSGGTVISSGLSIALRMLEQQPQGDRHVLLVSDLVDGVVDLPKLQSVVSRYQRERVDLRVITVDDSGGAGSGSQASFLQLPDAGFLDEAASQLAGSDSVATVAPGFPWLLVGIVLLIAVAAAAYEALLHPFTWRRT